MIAQKIQNALNRQVQLEAESSQLYLSMASWAEVNGLNGVAEFLFTQSAEERQHMLKLIRFLNERGGHGIVPALKQPAQSFASVHLIFEQVLAHETLVSNEINKLVDICLKEKDYTTHNFLQWYVSEQIEEEALARNVLDKLKLIGKDKSGLYFFDRDLQALKIAAQRDIKEIES